jgi:uncharacterized spore protein YtfJ
MKFADVLAQLPAEVAATRVYGEPYQTTDGATVITVAKIRGGGRGKRRTGDDAREGALGFSATPVGVFVIRGDEVKWLAAVDEDRIALVGVITGLAAAVIGTLAVLRRPPWPDLSVRRSRRGSGRA